MKKYLFLLLVSSISTLAAGQTCLTAVCTAASTSESAFLAALPASGNTNSSVVVNIPTGTSSWTTGFNYTVPSAVNSLTIQGNTSITWSGTAGTSSWTYVLVDNSIIQDAYTSNNSLMTFTTGNSSSFVRITGLTLEGGAISGFSKYNGVIQILSGNAEFRFDHNHCNWTTYSGSNTNVCVKTFTPLQEAVADHNVIDNDIVNTTYSFGFSNFGAFNDAYGNGDGTFANPTPWGALAGVFFVEANYMSGGVINDCGSAGSMVIRDNYMRDYSVAIQTHGTKTPAGPSRGCRSIEMYNNYFPNSNCGTCSTSSAVLGTKGTAALIWGNTVSGQPSYRLYQGGGDRQSGDECETAPTGGWGYCGTTAYCGSGPVSTGSAWDQNTNTATGYACLDGLGRGQDVQHLNGANFPSRLNSVTGTVAWSHQYLEPQYLWNNTLGTIGNYMLLNDGSINNKDYYYDCGSLNSSCSSFTGAAGTGFGLSASRPSTCTPGPGGASGTSPTGTYGVSYFSTDANSGQGELYICTATNTWTGIYQPAIYPHPLTGGAGVPSSPIIIGLSTQIGDTKTQ